MALFKLRKKVDEARPASAPAESIEAMRRRARHRLVGAAVLVLIGVVGFPLLFDTQPRPVAVDIPIEIPDRNKVKPLPPLPASPAPAVSGKVAPPPAPAVAVAAAPAPAPASAPQPTVITETREQAGLPPAPTAAPVRAPAAVAKADAKPPEKAAPSAAAAKTQANADAQAEPKADAAKAQALLEGKTVDTAAAGLRYVVQVGAFAEKDKAHAAQQKLARAGLKNYTQVAETGDGKRIRVRAGPFASRAEADRAAAKIKGLDLPVRILTL
jgi:DedD protein